MTSPTAPRTIEIVVSPAGSVRIKTSGFVGSACRDATRDLERALGITGREVLLSEFHAQHAQPEASVSLEQGR